MIAAKINLKGSFLLKKFYMTSYESFLTRKFPYLRYYSIQLCVVYTDVATSIRACKHCQVSCGGVNGSKHQELLVNYSLQGRGRTPASLWLIG